MLYIVNEKEPYASKQAISLNLVGTDKIVISDRFKHSNIGSKYFIKNFGYGFHKCKHKIALELSTIC